ncbi:hypothetical protein [Rufibacter immobilis]|uniref:hypothetical protein n=1 Tax=Rufibacter immobilis TaxID=1348778 RepID=UPI0035E5D0F2
MDRESQQRLKEKDRFFFGKWIASLGTVYGSYEETKEGNILLDLSSTTKDNLPTAIFNATHPSGCKQKGITWEETTKKLVIDLDLKNIPLEAFRGNYTTHQDLTESIFEAIEANSERLSGLLMGWVSPSGKGVKLVYNVDVESVAQLAKCQQRIIDDLTVALRFRLDQFKDVVDLSSNSAKQQCYLGKTERRFYCNNAQYLSEKKPVTKTAIIKNAEKKLSELEGKVMAGYTPADQVYRSGFDTAVVKYIYLLAGSGFTQEQIETACEKWLFYPDNNNHGGRIIYKEKIPTKIKEAVKGIIPRSNVGITNNPTSGEQMVFTHWWAVDSNNRLQINQSRLETALREHGFTYIKEDINKKMYVNRENVLTCLGTRNEDITDYLHRHFFDVYLKDANGNYIDKHEEIITKSKNLFLNSKDKFWLDNISLSNLDREDRKTIKLYLGDGVVQITQDSAVLIEYKDLPSPIFEEQIISNWNGDSSLMARYREVDWKGHDMVKVFRNIAENRQDKFDYLCSLIGYLISSHKSQGNNKIVMLMDGFQEDQTQIGGTGKSLIGRFISLLRKTDRMHTAKEGRFQNQTVTLGTQVLYLEDLKFSDKSITELRNFNDTYLKVEEKGKMPVVLEGYHCPRLLITTNYVPDSDADADSRRYHLFCVADHYSKTFTVRDDIGYELFNDFTQEDWDVWLSFAVYCCQLYLTNGVMYVDETHKLKIKRNAQIMNNIDNEDLVDWIVDLCEKVNALRAPIEFKLSDLKRELPRIKMGKQKLNDFIEEIVQKQGLTYDKQARDRHGNRINRISLSAGEMSKPSQRQMNSISLF